MGSTMSIYRSTKIMTLAGCALQLLVVEAGQTDEAKDKHSRRRLAPFWGDLYEKPRPQDEVPAGQAARGTPSPVFELKEAGATRVEARSHSTSPMDVVSGFTPETTPKKETVFEHGSTSGRRSRSPTDPSVGRTPSPRSPAGSSRRSGTTPRRQSSWRSTTRRSTSPPKTPKEVNNIAEGHRRTRGEPSRFTSTAPPHVARPVPRRARSSQANQSWPRSSSRRTSRSSPRPNPGQDFGESFKSVPIHYSSRTATRSSPPKSTNAAKDWASVVRVAEREAEILEDKIELDDLKIELHEKQFLFERKLAYNLDQEAKIAAAKERVRKRKERTRLKVIQHIITELKIREQRGATKSLEMHFLELELAERPKFLKRLGCWGITPDRRDPQYFLECLEEAQKILDLDTKP